jgi:hypothetical protein
LDIGVKKNNPNFVPLAKRVIIYVGRTSPQVTIDALVTELSSLSNIEREEINQNDSARLRLSKFSALMPNLSGNLEFPIFLTN